MTKTKAQMEEEAIAIERVINWLRPVGDDAFLTALEAALEARAGIDPEKLEAFSQRVSGRAWDMQRGIR